MKISKARLKQIIVEELEAVMNEEEEEVTTEGTDDDEQVEEGFISSDATRGPTHRDRPSYQRATVGGRVADRGAGGTPTLDAAADALGMSPSQLMMDLAKEMGVDLAGADEEPPMPMPEEGAVSYTHLRAHET